jgi:hypothetical protein
LVTLHELGASVLPDLDAKKVATEWFARFNDSIASNDTQVLSSLFVLGAFWRDILALTWDFRTFLVFPPSRNSSLIA